MTHPDFAFVYYFTLFAVGSIGFLAGMAFTILSGAE